MKKIVSLLLVLVMMLGLVACGASKPAETQAPATEAAVVTKLPSLKLRLLRPRLPWWLTPAS